MNLRKISHIVATTIGTATLAIVLGTTAQSGGVIADPPPTTTPPATTDGNGWGH